MKNANNTVPMMKTMAGKAPMIRVTWYTSFITVTGSLPQAGEAWMMRRKFSRVQKPKHPWYYTCKANEKLKKVVYRWGVL